MGIREIIFRGKTLNNEWVQGAYYHQTEFYGDDFERHYIITTTDELEDNMMNVCMVIPETVGQYTGLTDKNGKKIFENDIVQLTDIRYNNQWKAVVVFGNPYCQYSWGWNFQYIGKNPKVNTDILLWVEMEDLQVYCEVIGNITDNPELLGTK